MKSVIAAIAALAASVVSAQSIVSSQPSTNQVLTAGTTTKIVWNPVSGTISSIDLRKGDASALTFVSNVATNVDASVGSYSWAIDATLAAGVDYALSFGQSPNVTYTPFFTIQAAAGGAASSGNTTAAAGTTTTAAAAATTTAAAATTTTTKAAAAATNAAASGASSVASKASSAAAAATSTSGANKNVAAIGVAAVAGAVVAALI